MNSTENISCIVKTLAYDTGMKGGGGGGGGGGKCLPTQAVLVKFLVGFRIIF